MIRRAASGWRSSLGSFVLIGTGLAVMALGPALAKAAPLNGDFQTGDLSNWTVFTTPFGSNGGPGAPNVVLFDTNNSGSTSLAAEFNVGTESTGTAAGGGIYQWVGLTAGDLNISADIASYDPDSFNAEGGLFELVFGNGSAGYSVVADYDFGPLFIDGQPLDEPVTEFGTLSASLTVPVAGSYELRFRITRTLENEYIPPGNPTPRQYIDNVVMWGTAVPEPRTVLLLTAALLGLAALKRIRSTRS